MVLLSWGRFPFRGKLNEACKERENGCGESCRQETVHTNRMGLSKCGVLEDMGMICDCSENTFEEEAEETGRARRPEEVRQVSRHEGRLHHGKPCGRGNRRSEG